MMDYQEIITCLRNNSAQNNCHDCSLGYVAFQAADAIEQLMGQVPAQGHWICKYDAELGVTEVTCSHCGDQRTIKGCYESTTGESLYDEDSFCPSCGADMAEGHVGSPITTVQRNALSEHTTALAGDDRENTRITRHLVSLLMCADMARHQIPMLSKIAPQVFDEMIFIHYETISYLEVSIKDGALYNTTGIILAGKENLREKTLADGTTLTYWQRLDGSSGEDSGSGTLYFPLGSNSVISLDFSF